MSDLFLYLVSCYAKRVYVIQIDRITFLKETFIVWLALFNYQKHFMYSVFVFRIVNSIWNIRLELTSQKRGKKKKFHSQRCIKEIECTNVI